MIEYASFRILDRVSSERLGVISSNAGLTISPEGRRLLESLGENC